MHNRIQVFAKSFAYSLKLAWKAGKGLLVVYIVAQFVCATLPLLVAYVLSAMINDLVYAFDRETVLAELVLFALLTIFMRVAEGVAKYISSLLDQKIQRSYEIDFSNKLNELPLSFLDSSEGKDVIDEVTYVKRTATSYYKNVIGALSVCYAFVIALSTLVGFNLLFSLLFLVLTIPGIIVEHVFAEKSEKLRQAKAPDVRKFSYYKWMLLDKRPMKDVRMYDLSDDLRKRYNEEKDSYLKANKNLDKTKLVYAILAELIKRSGEIVFTIFVISEALAGHVTIGEIALYISFSVTVTNSFQTAADTLLDLFTVAHDQMRDFFKFYNHPSGKRDTPLRHVDEFESLEFRNVFFKYPLQENYVLKGVSFTLSKGDRLSIVGINGAGKTTIVKLMLGLYEIDAGEILLNGFPLSDYDPDEVHGLFSVMFQQFAQYSLSLRENVALSVPARMDDTDGVVAAMKQSGIWEQYRDHLDDNLTKQFDDAGIELSKGQWQKVALARTYFKNTPVIVFDEPSAALDAEAEDYILSNYCQLSENKTAVMISHRIYGAKFSTKIIVLSEGTIIEEGSHKELLERDGFYANLFHLQKEKYIYEGRENA